MTVNDVPARRVCSLKLRRHLWKPRPWSPVENFRRCTTPAAVPRRRAVCRCILQYEAGAVTLETAEWRGTVRRPVPWKTCTFASDGARWLHYCAIVSPSALRSHSNDLSRPKSGRRVSDDIPNTLRLFSVSVDRGPW